MSLTKTEKNQLKSLVQSPQWTTLEHLIKEMLEKYKDQFGAKDSEWETMKNNLLYEGRVRGLTELSQEIFLQIQSND